MARSFATSVACVLLCLVAGCKTSDAPAPPPPPPVEVATPTQRDVTLTAEFTGNTQAIESVEIRARVQGMLESFHFEPSGFVRQDDLLFEIERAPYVAAQAQAEADVASSEAYVRRTESDLERLQIAVKTNAVSQQEVTRATAERDQARAALQAAKAKLERARIDLDYTRIHSPIDGLISRQLVDPGNLVGRNDATLLAEVFNINPIHVYFEVNEQAVASVLALTGGVKARLKKTGGDQFSASADAGRQVSVRLDGVERIFEGRTDYIDPDVDPDTGTLQVRAVLPNDDGILLPGFFVRITLPTRELPNALLVPETALATDLGGRYLMVVDDQSLAQKRYVEPGQLQAENMRVILGGLEAGERFIVKGLQRARPGMPVTVATGS
jgi:RND family efflux transporter MFP subunit